MSGFYVSLIFFGIFLVLFSLLCIFLDKRKAFHFIRSFEDKKRELVEIINDAEQMIEELNKFSDYIVNQMDLKNEELVKNISDAEEKINALGERARLAVSEATVPISEAAAEKSLHATKPAVEVSGIAMNGGASEALPLPSIPSRKNEKVIPINNKYSEVIKLSQEGLYGYEIARRLNMGKGEVELILGLRKFPENTLYEQI